MAQIIFHESFGDVWRAQLALYRKANISPSDHDQLVGLFGEDRSSLLAFVKEHSPNGMYRAPWPFPTSKEYR